jgi:hypothetical protein
VLNKRMQEVWLALGCDIRVYCASGFSNHWQLGPSAIDGKGDIRLMAD